jgi:hypothetical protein
MKYLLLIYHNPGTRQIWASMTDEQQAEGLAVYAALNADLAASEELIVAEALEDTALTKRVTVRDDRTITSDGPFAEAKEQLAGMYLVECDSVERAIEIAARIPDATFGMIDVYPVMTYSGLEM